MISGWQKQQLGQVLKLEYGKPLEKLHRNPNGQFPVYGANGIKDRSDQYYFDRPSIIVGRKGSAGEVNLTESKFWPLDVTYFVTFDEESHDLKFLYYLLKWLNLPSLAKGVKPGINRNEVYSQVASFPERSEQLRIVGILDEAFDGIATAKANAEKNLQNARALFESYLDSVFANRGNDWSEKKIPEICLTFGRGKSRHRPRNEPSLYGGPYPFIQTGDLSNADHVVTSYSQTYSEKGLAQSKLWPEGTIGIAIVGATIGETGILGFDGCFPDSVIGMTIDPEQGEPFFVEYMLQYFKATIKSQGEGSARENINLATFDRLKFPIPPIREQKDIVKTVNVLREEIRCLETIYRRKIALLGELKKSLLHQAFNGQL